ncbi:hypothetical protein [Emcibacter sp. SYSU 3D8]|uniref:hypothetical protein n=1 Tax=Emcibacter sp. SYSU 3D8 TaxID=3133969 RepID=UPI0031FF404B
MPVLPASFDRHLHVMLPASLETRLKEAAARQDRKLSDFVRDALRRHVEKEAA